MAQSRAEKAKQVLTSWLGASGIEHSFSGVEGVVSGNNDTPSVKFKLVEKLEETDSDIYTILADDILDKDTQIGVLAFQLLTEAAGYGACVPIDRGAAPEKRANYKEDFDLVVMRHREFRAAPNPTREDFSRFQKVATTASRSFYNRNRYTCQRNGYGEDDLCQYALVWTVNFLHKYRLADDSGTQNERLLMSHLKQRFWQFFMLLAKKEKSINPTIETLRVSLYEDATPSPNATYNASTLAVSTLGQFGNEDTAAPPTFFQDPRDEEELDEAYVARNSRIDRTSEGRRRKSATALLGQLLAELPKETRIEKLREVSESPFVSEDARRTAIRYLRREGVELGDLDVDEDVGGTDATGA